MESRRTGEQLDSAPETWSCEREAHDGADRCLFHLSPDERQALGIEDDTVTEALRTAAETAGKESKTLVGAHLGTVDLNHERVTAADNHPLNLRHATVERFACAEAILEQPIDLRGATIDTMDWSEVTFRGRARLSEMTVTGESSLDGAIFEKDAAFADAVFEDALTADEARFHADTTFVGAEFRAPVSFDGVEFRGDANLIDDDVCFEDATFEAGASFRKAKFRYANFTACQFGDDADFDEATFTSDAEFAGAAFDDHTSFRGATFEGDADVLIDDADFSDVTFGDVVEFERATFGLGRFEGATFADDAKFTDVRFDDDAVLADATVSGSLTLTEVRFHSDVDASGLSVTQSVVARGAEFHGGDNTEDEDASFADVDIGGRLDLRDAEFRGAVFDEIRVSGTAQLDGVQFDRDASFSAAAFESRVELNEARFRGDTDFRGATFTGHVACRGAAFEGEDNVTEDDVTFAGADFEAGGNFEHAQFRYGSFEGVHFGGPAVFDAAVFERDAVFAETSLQEASFVETRFNGDVTFTSLTVDGRASFRGVEFRGGDNVRDDNVSFAGASFDGPVDFVSAQFAYTNFESVEFTDEARFEAAQFRKGVSFDESTFGDGIDVADAVFDRVSFVDVTFEDAAVFSGSDVAGEAVFDRATFTARAEFEELRFHDDASFTGTVFEGSVRFDGAEFDGGDNVRDDDVTFAQARFGDTVAFHRVEFAHAVFSEATFDGDASFTEATFTESAVFDDVVASGDIDVSFVRFDHAVSFKNATFQGSADLTATHFEHDARFDDATFAAGATFTGAEFGGGAHTMDDAVFAGANFGGTADFELAVFRFAAFTDVMFEGDAAFSDTEFSGEADFNRASFAGDAVFRRSIFNYAKFADTVIADSIVFDEAEFEKSVTFRVRPVDDEALIRLPRAVITGGRIEQPEEGSAFYDCTDAHVGEVELDDEHCEHGLFDHFRFCRTSFDGFDFTDHKDQLARTNWIIHEFAVESVSDEIEYANLTPDTLENTYLKAKNCASDFGDRKAAAEFFIKEMLYRRKKNLAVALDRKQTTSPTARTQALGRWLGNMILHQTCGYGERLWRVVYVSGAAVVLWGAFYTILGEGTRGQSELTTSGLDGLAQIASIDGLAVLGKNIYFSLVTFTTLGYGDIQPIGATASMLAGLEAFFGAMLVALVVFVLGRRVAW